MDPQGERIARNEAAYREVNEAIRAGRADQAADAPRPFVCECGRLGCNELVELTLGEYEAVRANPRRFLMLPGHEIPEVEHVERHDGGLLVTGSQARAWELSRDLAVQQVYVNELVPVHRSLEEFFMEITGTDPTTGKERS